MLCIFIANTEETAKKCVFTLVLSINATGQYRWATIGHQSLICVLGDGMNAYMAYKVTTKVRFKITCFSWRTMQQKWLSKTLHFTCWWRYCRIFLVLFTALSLSLSVSPAQTSMALFKNKDFSVKRRFSDFLGLHSKLASKYLHVGYIVPPAPEKSIVGKSCLISTTTMLFCVVLCWLHS